MWCRIGTDAKRAVASIGLSVPEFNVVLSANSALRPVPVSGPPPQLACAEPSRHETQGIPRPSLWDEARLCHHIRSCRLARRLPLSPSTNTLPGFGGPREVTLCRVSNDRMPWHSQHPISLRYSFRADTASEQPPPLLANAKCFAAFLQRIIHPQRGSYIAE